MSGVDLTTWDHVRNVFGENNAPEGGKAMSTIDFLIKSASAMIRRETARRFTIKTPRLVESRAFRVQRGSIVYLDELLDEDDIISITGPAGAVPTDEYEIEIDDEVPVTGAFLRLKSEPWPYDLARIAPEHEDYFTRNMNPPPGLPSNWPGQRVVVGATWGYTKVPQEIDFLCARAVQIWWDTNVVNYAENTDSPLEPPEALPQAVVQRLKKWKRPRVGAAAIGG